MTRKTDQDEREKQFFAFADKVAHLSDDDWRRLSASCADLNSASFGALIGRARLRAKASSITLPGAPLLARAIYGIGSAFATGIWFTYEVGREFDPTNELQPTRKTSSGDTRLDRLVDASFEIERAIAPRFDLEPGTAAVVRSAADALKNRGFIDASTFDAIYAFVEPVIPFASLTSQP